LEEKYKGKKFTKDGKRIGTKYVAELEFGGEDITKFKEEKDLEKKDPYTIPGE